MLQPALNLKNSSRMPQMLREGQGVRLLEIGTLMMCGVVCGHDYRLFSNTWITNSGICDFRRCTADVFRLGFGAAAHGRRHHVAECRGNVSPRCISRTGGNVQIAGFVSLLVLGPLLDLAALGTTRGWRLYARFVVAGGIANLIAFGARWLSAFEGWEMQGGGRRVLAFWPSALTSFILCGAVAGLISAMVWFRWRASD